MPRLTSLARLSNWPFALKMAFCPALAMLALMALGLYGVSATDGQATLIHTVVQRDLASALRLSGNATKLQEINGLLYRLTTLQASGAPGLDVAQEAAGLVERASLLAADLEEQQNSPGLSRDRDDLLRLVNEVRVYGSAIDVFGSMLEIDFPSAVAFIRPFDQNATRVLALINKIAEGAVQDARSRAAESARLADNIRHVTIAGSLTGTFLLSCMVGLMTSKTVLSVKRIAAATEQVAQGSKRVDVVGLARRDELGTIVQSLAVFQANVTQIAFLAHHDALTRLPNRVLFQDRVQQALVQVDRGAGFAVLCLDLDRFKAVNDTLGHPVGDVLLRQVAERLQACVREGDTVARLGGDEFAIILLDAGEPAEIDGLCARIIEATGVGYEIAGHQVNIGVSIGIALAPADGMTPDELLKNADTALYGAKANGRGSCCFYEAAMNAALQARRALEVGLRQAIAQEEFQLHYQPLVNARLRDVAGFEALIRWRHPERGMISPEEFIPVAEACGLIGAIGRWVLRTACVAAMAWPDGIKVAVNLSPLQFKDKHLVDSVRAALADSGLPASRLELEITESVLLHDSRAILAILRELKALGVQLSMDDFGTGYSSLSYLRSFPFDKVKIDRSFIRDLPHDRNSAAIVRAIVGLSATFGLVVTAEGVETEEQAAQLALENCAQLQGYLFSKPLPAVDIPKLLERLRTASMSLVAV